MGPLIWILPQAPNFEYPPLSMKNNYPNNIKSKKETQNDINITNNKESFIVTPLKKSNHFNDYFVLLGKHMAIKIQ